MIGKNTERMIIAAMLSVFVYGGTLFWYRSTANKTDNTESSKPVAFVDNVKEDVQRRPVEMLIWQVLTGGEPLYPGEVIRTNADSEVRIKFAEGGRFIDLDPDTEIVISQSSNEVSLDLMKGGLFVKQSETGDSGTSLMLNSGKGKVDLSTATASLSKQDGSNLNVQVLKGSAKIESNGQVKELDSGKSGGVNASGNVFDQAALQILSPSLEKPSFINLENPTPVQFSWKGLPEKSTVQLLVGTSRKNLKVVGTTNPQNPSLIKHMLKPGKYFWKLLAKNPTDQINLGESQTFRLEVTGRFAPTPIYPENLGAVQLQKDSQPILFKWFKPEDMVAVYFELSKDAEFKEKLFSKNILDASDLALPVANGEYYWRLSGTYEENSKPIVGKTIKFTVIVKPKIEVPPLAIKWALPGENNISYFYDQPETELSWKAENAKDVETWKVQIAETSNGGREPSSDDIKVHNSKQTAIKIPLEKAGKYWAVIEAYDKEGHLLGKSEPKIFEAQLTPLLPPPEFLPAGEELKADNRGRVDLKWNKIDGAKEYLVSFSDSEGKKLKEARFPNNSTSMVNLLPGKYSLEILSVDQKGRPGQRAPARALTVPDTSGLQAPKLKKIKVN